MRPLFIIAVVVLVGFGGCKKTKLDGEFSKLTGTWGFLSYTNLEYALLNPIDTVDEITFYENGTYKATGREKPVKRRVIVTEPKPWELEAHANYAILLRKNFHNDLRYAVCFPHTDTLLLKFLGDNNSIVVTAYSRK